MNAPGPRVAAEINLDEFERRLRAAGAQQGAWEDPLAELAKLVDASKRSSASPAGRQAVETELARRSGQEGALPPAHNGAGAQSENLAEETEDPAFEDLPDASPAEAQTGRRVVWTAAAVGLAIGGVAMIGAVFALRGGVPGLPRQVPFIAAAQGPTRVQPPSEENIASSSDSGASLLKDNGKSAVKVVTTEEQPIDLSAQASMAAAAQPAPPPQPFAADGTASGSLAHESANAPLVVATVAAPPPLSPVFPDPKPVRTVSLRPDGTPIPTPTPAVAIADASPAAVPLSVPPALPAKSGVKTVNEPAANAQPSTPKLELPAKPGSKSSARIAVAKTETTVPAEAANEPVAATKPEKPARPAKTQVAAAEPAAPAAPAQPVDATAATGGWAVQLAAPKSEAEAKSEIARLNEKYAKALNGSPIGVRKAVVNGETIYRLRVVGLSKADAAALCARLKGDGGECFIAK